MQRIWLFGGWLVAALSIVSCLLAVSHLRTVYAAGKLAMTRIAPEVAVPGDWATASQRILVIGDSRVAQWTPRPEVDGVSFAFSGLGGETLAQLTERFPRSALSLEPLPDRIVLASGINDLVAASLNSNAQTRIAANLPGYVTQLSRLAAERNIELILMSVIRPANPSPMRRIIAWSDALPGLVAAYNQALNDIAITRGLIIIDADRALVSGPGALPSGYARDAFHLSPAGYRALNPAFVSALRE